MGTTADMALAYGSLSGGVPFTGKVWLEDGEDKDITGNLQWKTRVPDSRPEEGKLKVALFLYVRDREVRTPKGELRLGCDMVLRLMARDVDAERELLETVAGRANAAGPERFEVHCVQ